MPLSLIAPMCCSNHAIKCVLDHFFIQVEIFNENEMLQRSLHVSYYYVLFVKINFYVQFLKLNFQGNDLNLRIKSLKLKRFHVR